MAKPAETRDVHFLWSGSLFVSSEDYHGLDLELKPKLLNVV